jgi:hypothetical protein
LRKQQAEFAAWTSASSDPRIMGGGWAPTEVVSASAADHWTSEPARGRSVSADAGRSAGVGVESEIIPTDPLAGRSPVSGLPRLAS